MSTQSDKGGKISIIVLQMTAYRRKGELTCSSYAAKPAHLTPPSQGRTYPPLALTAEQSTANINFVEKNWPGAVRHGLG
jgi:hypothetical protein